jgi:serine/threonine-protein kinase
MRAAGTGLPRIAFAFGTVGLALFARPAQAQSATDSATAQALFEEARTLLKAGRAAEACPKLEESQRLDPGSGTLLNLARCYETVGRVASAWNKYLEAASAAASSGNAARENEARQRAATLRPKLPKLSISIAAEAKDTPGLVVTRDGERVGEAQWGLALPADPGQHTVAASAPGRASWQATTTVSGAGTTVAITVPALALAPMESAPVAAPPSPIAPPPSAPLVEGSLSTGGALGTQRVLAIVAGGVGVVGLAVGTVFGLKSKSKHDEAAKYCDGTECREPRGVSAGEAAYSAGNVSTVGMVVGALGVAGGVTLWLTAPRKEAARAQLALGLGSLELSGVW